MRLAPTGRPTRAQVAMWLALAGLAVAPRLAAQQDSLDLAAALALARARSPVLSGANAAVESAEGRLLSARSNRWARVSADALYLRFQDPPGLAFGGLGALAPIPENGYYLQLGVQQPLYTGGRVANAVRAAQWGTRGSRATRRQAEVELTAAVAHAHDAALLAQALLGVAEEGSAVLDSAAAQARTRLSAGTTDRLDVLRAETRLGSARADVRRARGDLAAARERLAALIGLDPAAVPTVAGALEPVPAALDSAAVASLVARARHGRPDLDAFDAAARGAEAAAAASGSLRPTVSLFVNGLVTRPELVTGATEWSSNLYGGVVVRWPVFDFGAAGGQAAAARADAARLRAEALQVAKDAVAEVLDQARDLARAAEDVAEGRENVARAGRALGLAQQRYAEGVGIQLEVLEAEADQVRTRADLFRAIHSQRSASVELRRLTGQPADGALLAPAQQENER